MSENQDKLNILLDKLNSLVEKQETFSKEIEELRNEINRATSSDIISVKEQAATLKQDQKEEAQHQKVKTTEIAKQKQPKIRKSKSDLEKFIGENLINKIGIAITVIGVAIGAKYSIDNNLINPLTRIILGYLAGIALLGFGIKLKAKYENYSAVLVSGSMAIMYFITYAAYNYYDLFPQIFSFILMLIFTAFTVLAAINYNKQVVAHIGLVGAYAVPFLLSEDTGRVAILFSYMVIVNLGILAVSIKKYWKPLYYSSFSFTWLIYLSWFIETNAAAEHFGLAFIFLSIFFAIFYISFLAHKLINNEKFSSETIALLLSNSFLFYGLGYALLADHESGQYLLGIFTMVNAAIHFVISLIIYRKKLTDKNLLYLISGLVLVFITITIPVQLDGNWVTLLWAGEAALLFWIGRTKNNAMYEKLSYPLMILAFFSLPHDWWNNYGHYDPAQPETKIIPVFNVNFLSTMIFVCAFGFINFINQSKKYSSPLIKSNGLFKIVSITLPAIFIFTLYMLFSTEIELYWDQLFTASAHMAYNSADYDIFKFKSMWIYNYSLLFFTLLSIANIIKIKNSGLAITNIVINTLLTVSFLIGGLYTLSELRDSYINQTLAEYYNRDFFHILIRYISFAFFAGFLVTGYKYVRQTFLQTNLKKYFNILLHTSIVWVLSSELITWLKIAESEQSYKLSLSILWGLYSLFVIIIGIWKNRQHLRIWAIILFGITLIKLFFYDIAHLDTIAKTIVFVSLGLLLLIISFLYNKYKHLISNEK